MRGYLCTSFLWWASGELFRCTLPSPSDAWIGFCNAYIPNPWLIWPYAPHTGRYVNVTWIQSLVIWRYEDVYNVDEIPKVELSVYVDFYFFLVAFYLAYIILKYVVLLSNKLCCWYLRKVKEKDVTYICIYIYIYK